MLSELPALGCWAPVIAPAASAAATAAPDPPELDAPFCEPTPELPAVNAPYVQLDCRDGTTPVRKPGFTDEQWCAHVDGTRYGMALECAAVGGEMRVQAQGFYEADKKVWGWSYYDAGYLQREESYVAGQLDGETVYYHRGRHVALRLEYRRGLLHGKTEKLDPSGRKLAEGHYENGLKHGIFRSWAPDGRLLGQYQMSAGTGTEVSWCDSGQVSSRTPYAGGVAEGAYESFHCDGQPQSTGTFVKGRREGHWIERDPRGRVVRDDQYQGGLLHGASLENWPETAGRRRAVSYHEGQLEGPAEQFDEQGRKVAEGTYHENQPDGRWTSFQPDGKKSEEILLKERVPRRWTLWNPDGTRLSLAEMDDTGRLVRLDGTALDSCLQIYLRVPASDPHRGSIEVGASPIQPCHSAVARPPEKKPPGKPK
jgi:antitoxin component YwqK of YwqJK toxin-antitoxin module